MKKLRVGDLVDGRKVIDVLENSVLLSMRDDRTIGSAIFTYEEIEKNNWKIERKEEKWIPEIGEKYFFPDIGLTRNSSPSLSIWANDKTDQHRLELNLVFKTEEEAKARYDEIMEVIKWTRSLH